MSEVFPWPRALNALMAAIEADTLEPRALFPVEVSAVCQLTAGMQAAIGEAEILIAPSSTISRRNEHRGDEGSFTKPRETRAIYSFCKKISNGRTWRIELCSQWTPTHRPGAEVDGRTNLRPRNVAQSRTWIEMKGAA
jgi:hypothetical protein